MRWKVESHPFSPQRFRLNLWHFELDTSTHALQKNETILIYGDNDVDGITGTTLLVVTSQLFLKNPQVNDLTAAGFTEIKVKRGKWGIFPYREQSR